MISSHSSFLPLILALRNKIPVKIRQKLSRFFRWEYFGITILVLITFGLHLSVIGQPASPMFDEGQYIPEARSIIAGQGPINIVHPPLAKLFIVAGMLLFGDNPFGWRFFAILFGTVSIALFSFICRKLGMSRSGQFMATFVYAFENLNFVQSSVAMLDVYMVTFMLGGFLLYLHRKAFGSGLFVALSTLGKLTSVTSLFCIILDWLFQPEKKLRNILILSLTAAVSFLILFTVLSSAVFGYIINPFMLLKVMFTASIDIAANTVFQQAASRPWDWIVFPVSIFYSVIPQYIAMLSLTVWLLIIPAVIYMVRRAIKGSPAGRFGLAWFAGTFLSIVLLVLFTGRVTFIYYFYPAIGAVCIGIGLGLQRLWEMWKANRNSKKGRAAIIILTTYLELHIILFIVFSPIGPPLVKWLPLGI